MPLPPVAHDGDVIRGELVHDLVTYGAAFFPVLDPIEPGYSVRAPATSVLPTGAVEAVTDDTPYTDAQALVVARDSDRIDLDTMEHERQRRLRSWQRQP